MAGRGGKKGESPVRVLGRIRKALEGGWPPGLTVLTGDDLYHLDAAQKLILDHLAPEAHREFALTVFGDERAAVAEVVASARSVGMFAPRRVVLVRDVEALEGEPDALGPYAGKPPRGSYVLVRAPRLDQRFKIPKALVRHGRLLVFRKDAAQDTELRREVRKLAAERDLQLAAGAVELLLGMTDADLHRVSTELDKLAAWLEGETARRVTPETVREVGAGSATLTNWEVLNAFLDGDAGTALAAMRRLVVGPGEALPLVGALAFTVRNLIQARVLRDRRVPDRDIVQATRMWRNEARLLRAVARLNLRELLSMPARLLEADLSLKSRSIPARAVMESLVLDLMGSRPARSRGREGA